MRAVADNFGNRKNKELLTVKAYCSFVADKTHCTFQNTDKRKGVFGIEAFLVSSAGIFIAAVCGNIPYREQIRRKAVSFIKNIEFSGSVHFPYFFLFAVFGILKRQLLLFLIFPETAANGIMNNNLNCAVIKNNDLYNYSLKILYVNNWKE